MFPSGDFQDHCAGIDHTIGIIVIRRTHGLAGGKRHVGIEPSARELRRQEPGGEPREGAVGARSIEQMDPAGACRCCWIAVGLRSMGDPSAHRSGTWSGT